MNRLIEVNKPQNSLFVNKIKIIVINNYSKFIYKLFKSEGEIIKNNDIFKDFYNYMTKYLKKCKNKFELEQFINDCKDKNEDLNHICNIVLELLFDINMDNEVFLGDINFENLEEKNHQQNDNNNISEEDISNNDKSNEEDLSITTNFYHCELSDKFK